MKKMPIKAKFKMKKETSFGAIVVPAELQRRARFIVDLAKATDLIIDIFIKNTTEIKLEILFIMRDKNTKRMKKNLRKYLEDNL